MTNQISLFDGAERLKIHKPIRLIELFAGIGAQAKALKNLDVPFEHYRICEFDKYAVNSYNAIHKTDFESSDITKISAADLGICETDKYDYIMTYSYPCQDVSVSGKQKGMKKGSNTRSGLLWEVERLLRDCIELPQILLMENVPAVHGQKNVADFANWISFLDGLGYKSKWVDLNAKDYGIPQNRDRCFMVSWLGDYYFDFPKAYGLNLRLKDLLEKNVDEKYYLSEKALLGIKNTTFSCSTLENRTEKDGIIPTLCARDYKDPKLVVEPLALDEQNKYVRTDGLVGTLTTDGSSPKHNNRIIEPQLQQVAQLNTYDQSGRIYSPDGLCPTINTMQGGGLQPKIMESMHNYDYRIRKLTPLECWRLMGFSDTDFDRASKVNSNSQLYKQAGNSIVTTVLMAIFGELTDTDWREKIKEMEEK